MWLINASTLSLELFHGENIPPYAILSHTWGAEEISFQEFTKKSGAPDRAGYAKIAATCIKALDDGHSYVWIDTCCIEKTSSAELTEAINSMFSWYHRAEICYAYLSDLHSGPQDDGLEVSLRKCRWFTRGWCLQELLAPQNLVLLNQNREAVSTKINLCALITAWLSETNLGTQNFLFRPSS